ncbi:hypothetical protein HPP92_000279 [Vanilla planifolia]|uniref:Uncharacterized protein n=1 Tax=Vanilla planifolia TaxID=51239 RepID=A0A835SAX3_VANPL|nr:hypothetical protein HPP92_000279 [Vanilla planifolia]
MELEAQFELSKFMSGPSILSASTSGAGTQLGSRKLNEGDPAEELQVVSPTLDKNDGSIEALLASSPATHGKRIANSMQTMEHKDECKDVSGEDEEKKARQKETPDFSNPIVTSEEIYEKVSKLQDKVSAVNRIPKPKPKVEKPPKEDSTSNNNSTDGTNSTPDDESIKKDQPAEESSGSTTSDDVKPEPHDEL